MSLAFRGRGRTLGDGPKKAASAPVPPQPEVETQQEAPPGPDNRSMKVLPKSPPAPVVSPEVDPKEYDLRSTDVAGMLLGDKARPKYFGEVRRPVPRTVTSVKFKFEAADDHRSEIPDVEAKFAASESTAALYEFLLLHVLADPVEFVLINSFPRRPIPQSPTKTLASIQLTGPVLLVVESAEPLRFKPELLVPG